MLLWGVTRHRYFIPAERGAAGWEISQTTGQYPADVAIAMPVPGQFFG